MVTFLRSKPYSFRKSRHVWVPAPEEECGRLLQFLYENSVQPELWQDAISYWYPQAEQAENLREGGASCEL